MDSLISFIVNVGWLIVLVTIGFLFGRWNERRHYRSIFARESNLADILVFSARHPPADIGTTKTRLVRGSAAIAQDRFKDFLAGIRHLVGGRMSSYETLLDRARREAILRMKANARDAGCAMIFNVRFETARIASGVEVLAYGTACDAPDKAAGNHGL